MSLFLVGCSNEWHGHLAAKQSTSKETCYEFSTSGNINGKYCLKYVGD